MKLTTFDSLRIQGAEDAFCTPYKLMEGNPLLLPHFKYQSAKTGRKATCWAAWAIQKKFKMFPSQHLGLALEQYLSVANANNWPFTIRHSSVWD